MFSFVPVLGRVWGLRVGKNHLSTVIRQCSWRAPRVRRVSSRTTVWSVTARCSWRGPSLEEGELWDHWSGGAVSERAPESRRVSSGTARVRCCG